MKKFTIFAVLILTNILLIAQSGPTPAPNLRVRTDANNLLMTTLASQVEPISQPTPFEQIRLKTDASGNLLVACDGCGSGDGDVTGPASAVVGNIPYYNNTNGKVIASDNNIFWNATNQQLNILGGVVGNNGPLLVTRKATGGNPVLASGISVYRNSQYNAGTPTANDIVNAEFLLQGSDNLWYTVGAVGGKITNIAAPAGGPIFHCKPTAALGVDNVIPCMFLSSTGKLRVGDGNVASADLEVKNTTTNFVLSSPTLSANQTIGVFNQIVSFFPANPTGTTSSTDVMSGLGSTLVFTPSQTGRVNTRCSLIGANSLSTGGTRVTMYRGTGTAPANGVAVTGTQAGGAKIFTAIANNQQINFMLDDISTGLVIGTTYWFDIAIRANTTGTASISFISCVLTEI